MAGTEYVLMANSTARVCVDFDRVLHKYRASIGHGYAEAFDPPVPGAAKLLHSLKRSGYRICIHTTRARTPEGAVAVARWMRAHAMPYDELEAKPEAAAYIDDRAIAVTGRRLWLLRRWWIRLRVWWLRRWGAGS